MKKIMKKTLLKSGEISIENGIYIAILPLVNVDVTKRHIKSLNH